MSDEAWRAHERRWRRDATDQDALGRAIAGMRRSGLVVPADLLDARIEPATTLETTLPLEVWAVLPGEREPTTVGWGPGTIAIPPHRYWGVGDVPAGLEGLGALGDELRGRGIPGVRLRQLSSGRSQDPSAEEGPTLDQAALAALGPQPHLRWIEVRTYSRVTPGQLVRALGCLGLEVFRSDGLEDEDEETGRSPLEGFEALRDLVELELTHCGLEAADLRRLEGLPRLEALGLVGSELGPAELARTELRTRLRRLQLGRFDREDGRAVLELGQLTSVLLSREDLWPWRAQALAALPNLRELVVHQDPFQDVQLDEALAHLRSTRLSSLVVTGTPSTVSDVGLAAALSIESLRSLNLGAWHAHGAGAPTLDLRRLRRLDISCRGPCSAALRNASELESLTVWGSPVSGVLDAAASLPALERLDLGMRDSPMPGPRVLTHGRLRSLSARSSLGRTDVVAPLRTMDLFQPGPTLHALQGPYPELERLRVSCTVSPDDVAALRRLSGLRALQLSFPSGSGLDVADRVLDLLHGLPGLRRLSLTCWDLPDDLDSPWRAHLAALARVRAELPWIAVDDEC